MKYLKYKYLAAIFASGLVVAYVAPTVLKLKNVALTAVVLIGVVMLLIDLWQSLHEKGD